MRKSIMIGAVTLMCVTGAAGAQETGSISGEQAVQARRAGMFMSGAIMASMKAGIDAGASPRAQVFPAGTLARWAGALPGVFPAGSGQGAAEGTKAKAEIWADRADFEAKAAAYAAAATRLQELARADDAAGFAAQWTEVRASCQACHDVYKAD